MNFVELPQHRHVVEQRVRDEAAEIVRDEEEQREDDTRDETGGLQPLPAAAVRARARRSTSSDDVRVGEQHHAEEHRQQQRVREVQPIVGASRAVPPALSR